MKLTHLALGAVLTVGLAFAAVKGFVHVRVKNAIDDALDRARLFVDIQYKDLDTDLDGAATLTDITIFPNDFPESFRIDALTLRGPDLDFLINGFESVGERGELPARLEMHLQGLRLRTEGYLLGSLQKSISRMGELLQVQADGCGLSHYFGYQNLAALGHKELLINLHLGYRFIDSRALEIDFGFSAGAESITVKTHLTELSRSLAANYGQQPKLRDLEVRYRFDADITQQLIQHCMQKRGVDRATYFSQLDLEPDELYMLNLGFVPGPGIRQALRDMLSMPGEMLIKARPYEPITLNEMGLYSSAQLPDLLGLSVSVNDRPITDLSHSTLNLAERLDLDPVAVKALQNEGVWVEAFGIEPAELNPIEEPQYKPKPGTYRKIDQRQLAEHIGQPVRIIATGGRKRSGVLMRLEHGIATLEEHVYGGTLTTRVVVSEIKQVEAQF